MRIEARRSGRLIDRRVALSLALIRMDDGEPVASAARVLPHRPCERRERRQNPLWQRPDRYDYCQRR